MGSFPRKTPYILYYVLLVINLLLLSYNCIVERKTLVRKHLQRFITKSIATHISTFTEHDTEKSVTIDPMHTHCT